MNDVFWKKYEMTEEKKGRCAPTWMCAVFPPNQEQLRIFTSLNVTFSLQ